MRLTNGSNNPVYVDFPIEGAQIVGIKGPEGYSTRAVAISADGTEREVEVLGYVKEGESVRIEAVPFWPEGTTARKNNGALVF